MNEPKEPRKPKTPRAKKSDATPAAPARGRASSAGGGSYGAEQKRAVAPKKNAGARQPIATEPPIPAAKMPPSTPAPKQSPPTPAAPGGAPAPRSAAPSREAQAPAPAARKSFSLLSSDDIYLFNEGSHHRLYEKLGAHRAVVDGVEGTQFAVWAPNAQEVSVIGNFNDWDRERNRLHPHGGSGIWEGFVPGAKKGDLYKFFIRSRFNHYAVEKADPFGVRQELPPRTGSVIW
ncbi:MAG TPA: 1,4-alpha-glucan branching protein GlgB, partial [Thermoanaerobaculia bacterium]|nr:1,4-alpha-glucan branching protein GlgB [Thermoanaerobaculia bacterium]